MSASATDHQAYFDELASWISSRLRGDEVVLITLDGEITDFVRFNHADVRQAGSITQSVIRLDLIEGERHTEGSVMLARDPALDRARLERLVDELREQRRLVPIDPYLLYNTEPVSSEAVGVRSLPAPDEALADIRAVAGSHDLVGVYAAGDTFTGFASSFGQRNWHQTATFNLDWSFYLRADKAAKNLYAGFEWDQSEYEEKVAWSSRQLEALDREPITIAPGDYRTFLAPAALHELVELWAWGGFSERSHRTRQTPLLRMVTEGVALDPRVEVSEDTKGGVAPNFQEAGFPRPDEVALIEGGAYRQTLVSPRSAREYGVEANGASSWEAPDSLAMAPGELESARAVEQVGQGLYVGNLWYTNYSDRAACRTTGMTRFASFWVEDGEIAAPVNVMRFDDTIYSLLGDNLVGLTDQVDVILDPSSYEQRSTSSVRLPGVLVDAMTFTL